MVVQARTGEDLSAGALRRSRERGRLDGRSILLQGGQAALEQAIETVERWAGADRIAPAEAERRGAYAEGLREALTAGQAAVN